jgi:hypothetical protein
MNQNSKAAAIPGFPRNREFFAANREFFWPNRDFNFPVAYGRLDHEVQRRERHAEAASPAFKHPLSSAPRSPKGHHEPYSQRRP